MHGVCDIAHTEGLFRALGAEMSIHPPKAGTDLFEGVNLLSALIQSIVPPASKWQSPTRQTSVIPIA